MRRSSRSRAETTSRRPLGRKSIHIGNDGNWTWTMTSLLPSRSTAMTSWAPQSENHRRSSCHRGDSPNAMPVIRVCSSGVFFIVFFLFFHPLLLLARRKEQRRLKRTSLSRQVSVFSLAPLSEDTLSAAQNNRKDHEPIFIDEVQLCQRVNKLATPENQNVLTALVLESGHLFREIALDQAGIPLHLGEGR